MGNEFILTVGSIRKNSQLLVDDGLKTWFNPSKEPNPLVYLCFWSKLKHIIEVNIYLILFLNTTHNNSKKRLKTIYSF